MTGQRVAQCRPTSIHPSLWESFLPSPFSGTKFLLQGRQVHFSSFVPWLCQAHTPHPQEWLKFGHHPPSQKPGGKWRLPGAFSSRFQWLHGGAVEGGDLRNRREGWVFLPPPSNYQPPQHTRIHTIWPLGAYTRTQSQMPQNTPTAVPKARHSNPLTLSLSSCLNLLPWLALERCPQG